MRHIPIAEFKSRVCELVAAVEAGEEIVITRHGKPAVKLVGIEHAKQVKQQEAVNRLFDLGQEILRDHGPTTREEIRAWIDEGRE